MSVKQLQESEPKINTINTSETTIFLANSESNSKEASGRSICHLPFVYSAQIEIGAVVATVPSTHCTCELTTAKSFKSRKKKKSQIWLTALANVLITWSL